MGLWRTTVNLARRSGRVVTSGLKGGERMLGTGGRALKTATVGAGVGYVGWQALVNDKPVVRTVADLAIGSDTVDSVKDTVGGAVDGVANVTHQAADAFGSVTNAINGNGNGNQGTGIFGGMGNFMQALCSGNGGNMIGDFFRNIGNGNVSGLSLAALIGAGILIFGRFGWLGKIIGVLLGMMIIGGHINMGRVMGTEQPAPSQQQQPDNSAGRTPVQVPLAVNPNTTVQVPAVHRTR